jgi:hypothetical protein
MTHEDLLHDTDWPHTAPPPAPLAAPAGVTLKLLPGLVHSVCVNPAAAAAAAAARLACSKAVTKRVRRVSAAPPGGAAAGAAGPSGTSGRKGSSAVTGKAVMERRNSSSALAEWPAGLVAWWPCRRSGSFPACHLLRTASRPRTTLCHAAVKLVGAWSSLLEELLS